MGDSEQQYRLIIYSNPSDSKSHENRRCVRSHVTKRQHRSMKKDPSSSSTTAQRNRRKNNEINPSLRHAVDAVSKQIDPALSVFMPAPHELSPVDSMGLLSPTSFQTNRNFDDVFANANFQHLSRSGSISSGSVQPDHHQQQQPQSHPMYECPSTSSISYATPPPEFQDHCNPHAPRPIPALPYIVPNDDAQSAYETSILLLKSTGSIAQEYELTLESLACAKISAALRALNIENRAPSDGLMRAIVHMAHYDQIAPRSQHPGHLACSAAAAAGGSLFNHHMECLVDCVKRVGGFGRLRPDLQHYVLQVDHAVAGFRGTGPFFAVASGMPVVPAVAQGPSPLLSPVA